MATYNYLDDVLDELRKDKDAKFDISMLNNLSLSIGE